MTKFNSTLFPPYNNLEQEQIICGLGFLLGFVPGRQPVENPMVLEGEPLVSVQPGSSVSAIKDCCRSVPATHSVAVIDNKPS